MKLKQLTNRIWYYGPDQAMDRPLLGYIKGDEKSMAVDVGFSPDHAKKFYRAIGLYALQHLTYKGLYSNHTLALGSYFRHGKG